MNYIVLDLEWNQPYSKKDMVRKPIRLSGEIIQIGAVKLDENFDETDSFDRMIKPKYYRKMNRRVHQITLFTDEDLQEGISFEEAIEDFKAWCGSDYVFVTWGPDDMYIMEDNLYINGIDAEWLPENFDAQIMFDDLVTMEERNYSLSYAIWKLGIKPFSAHNALNDAINTVQVVRKIDAAEWIAAEREYLASVEAVPC